MPDTPEPTPTPAPALPPDGARPSRPAEAPSGAIPPSTLTPWPRHESRREDSMLLFRPRWDLCENPRNGLRMERLVLEMPSWVNVVARTRDGAFLFVRQWRFGTERLTLEIPGGVVDPGEEPLAAARRELREETGFEAARWSALGSVEPNPAFQDNRCYHYFADDAAPVGALELDSGEDIEVLQLSEEAVRAAVRSGEIDHVLVLSALSRVLDLREVRGAPAAGPNATRSAELSTARPEETP